MIIKAYNLIFKYLGLTLVIVSVILLTASMRFDYGRETRIIISPQKDVLMTGIIQDAIDSCASSGGGVVKLSEGTYLCGGLQIKNHVSLILSKGTLLQGSDKYSDYKNDAFIFGKDVQDISITGEGIIDGVDCYNQRGEEGFRGPHCIRLINCKNISIEGITIKNAANWAINCRFCSNGTVKNVSIRGGHDGLHTRFCSDFTVNGCDFRTGDDAFAGNDNMNFKVSDCKVNTSCNGFRFGCQNLYVNNCTFWGPGEYVHKIQKRNNMLSAFVHFSPKDEKPKIASSNWVIRNVTAENVDQFYNYNFENGLWQTGQPVTSISFDRITATGLLKVFSINGGSDRQLKLSVTRSSFSYREGNTVSSDSFEGAKSKTNAFFSAVNFGSIDLNNVSFEKSGDDPLLIFNTGTSLIFNKVTILPEKHERSVLIESVTQVKQNN